MTQNKKIGIWLLSVALMVMIMTLIGAITRLTESGLSITEWKPITGAIPPIGEAAWAAEFDKYKATPEFAQKHFWMTVQDFKQIYFWEWLHRFWGRLIGIAYAGPLIFFFMRGYIQTKSDRLKLFGLFILGGMQGALGWFMVKSGLVDEPSVSHYRLAAHLALALLLYSLLFLQGMAFIRRDKAPLALPRASCALQIHGIISLALVCLTILWGAFTAGLDAGMIYNTFPKMGAGLVPPDMWAHFPKWLNLFENHASVQFMHRLLAVLTGLVVLAYAAHGFKFDRKHFGFIGIWVCVQIILGIGTLMMFGGENQKAAIHIAATHQFGAVMLLTITLLTLYRIKLSRAKISL
ncbi:MAG: heme A synthase [Micavibrio aeruginosavorus]|uniref:Heme A synthase n=1 Tax=Micavibrio aeruginosavorus TaxID=349221 RepID=A0A2W5FN69_9BACT|nr:MAG: heme A synthase [Micavibrio aeruginosavorus]